MYVRRLISSLVCITLSLSGTILFTCFIGELAAAVRKKADIKFGVYHSLFEWYNPLYLFYRWASSRCTQEGGYQVGCVSIILSVSGTILFTCFIGELAAAVRKKADIKLGVYQLFSL